MKRESLPMMIEGMSLLLEGFVRNQQEILSELGTPGAADGAVTGDGLSLDTAAVIEMRAVIEQILDSSSFSTVELEALVAVMTDALEQIGRS